MVTQKKPSQSLSGKQGVKYFKR